MSRILAASGQSRDAWASAFLCSRRFAGVGACVGPQAGQKAGVSSSSACMSLVQAVMCSACSSVERIDADVCILPDVCRLRCG